MTKNYACVMGISENNQIDEPADFWQVIFHQPYSWCKKGKNKGYIFVYSEHEEYEDETIQALNKKIKKIHENWGLMWFQKLPVSYISGSGYCLVNGDGKIITKFNK
jgi:hypothetical protein